MLFYWRGNRKAGEIKAHVDSIAGYLWVLAHLAFSLKASVSIKLAKENVWNILIHTVHIWDGSSGLEAIEAPLVLSLWLDMSIGRLYRVWSQFPICKRDAAFKFLYLTVLSPFLRNWNRQNGGGSLLCCQSSCLSRVLDSPKSCFSRIPFSQFADLRLLSVC